MFVDYGDAVDEVMQYCEASLLNVRGEKTNVRGSRVGRQSGHSYDNYRSLCMSICMVWGDMEGLFAARGVLGSMVTKKISTDWAKRLIAREMSTIMDSLQMRVMNVLREGDRVDVEATLTLGWRRELQSLDEVFSRPAEPHPMCAWIDAQVKKVQSLQEELKNMANSARRMRRVREKVTPMDFVFAVAVHNSAVNLAV